MSMRALYRAKETQVPVTWTIIIGTNEAPNVERWDDAIGRRVVKIPSGPTIDPREVDLDLENKILTEEAEGVLASLVRGCVSWFQARSATGGSGLIMPTAVAEATREFQDENDHVAAFLHACVDFGPYSVSAAEVNKAYVAHRGGKGKGTYGTRALYSRILTWCQENGVAVAKDGRNFYGLQLASRDQAQAAQYQQWTNTLSAARP
jgi:phage/plasmid-associated DNA primase